MGECKVSENSERLDKYISQDEIPSITEIDSENAKFVSKVLPQYLASFAAHITAIALGAGWFWSATGVPSMASSGELGDLTKSDKSWITSTPMLGAVLMCPITGYCINRFGRRSTLMWAAVPQAISWFVIAFSMNIPVILVARVVIGAICSLSGQVGPVLIAECVESSRRGLLMCMFEFVICVGILYIYLVGSYFNWHVQSIAVGLISVVAFGALYFIPESPYYLMEKNDKEGAIKSLCWLRGAPTSDLISSEIKEVSETVKSSANNAHSSFRELLKDRAVVKPILLSMALMTFFQTTYINAILNTVVEIFQTAGSYDEYFSTILIGVIQVVSTLIPMILSDRVGRRILLLISLVMVATSLGGLGLYFNLQNRYGASSDFMQNLNWVPLTALICYTISCSIGIVPLSWVLMSEILPPRAKGLATGLVGLWGRLFGFFVVFTFWDANEFLGSDGTYWMIASFNLAAALFIFLFMPETRGKTLEEIQAYFENSNHQSRTTKM